MKVIIADDEPLARDILKRYLSGMPGVQCIGTCKNALEVFALMGKEKPDLLLLDINMPEMSGIDFLRSVKDPPLVIFTTAYAEYAVESYELNAVDYLLKPISLRRFQNAMGKAARLLEQSRQLNKADANDEYKSLFVRSEGKWIQVNLAELWLVEGLKDYLRLNVGEQRITIHSTMKNFEEQLMVHRNFIRVHKSYIINLRKVDQISGSSLTIGGAEIAIGSTYRDTLKDRMDELKLVYS